MTYDDATKIAKCIEQKTGWYNQIAVSVIVFELNEAFKDCLFKFEYNDVNWRVEVVPNHITYTSLFIEGLRDDI